LANIPRTRPLSAAKVIAANLRSLFWKRGLGYNEVATELDLSKSILYDIMRGTRQTEDTLAKLGRYFQVSNAYLTDPASPRYDTELVLGNVVFLARNFGVAQLPCSETLTNIAEKRHLPSGKVVKQLADAVTVPLEQFLTTDLSLQPDLQLKPCWRTERALKTEHSVDEAQRKNFSENLRLYLLLAGWNAREAAQTIRIGYVRMGNYVAGRSFPPAEALAKIAGHFQTSAEAMGAPAPKLDPQAIGARITERLGQKGIGVSKAAWKLKLGVAKFRAVCSGTALPNGRQLKRIAGFLEEAPASILGLKRVDNSDPPARGADAFPAKLKESPTFRPNLSNN
jgi:transcriptional regulator with XRE-family HTH domain